MAMLKSGRNSTNAANKRSRVGRVGRADVRAEGRKMACGSWAAATPEYSAFRRLRFAASQPRASAAGFLERSRRWMQPLVMVLPLPSDNSQSSMRQDAVGEFCPRAAWLQSLLAAPPSGEEAVAPAVASLASRIKGRPPSRKVPIRSQDF
jgi:hypothetical protein